LDEQTGQFALEALWALNLSGGLDEATGLGNVIPLLRSCQLPLSYLTNGQNVPDDIEAAECRRLARAVLGMSSYV
jgi:flagellar biosynthesis protein FlhF